MEIHMHPIHEETIHTSLYLCYELMRGNTDIINQIYNWKSIPNRDLVIASASDQIYNAYVKGYEMQVSKRKCFEDILPVINMFPTNKITVTDSQARYIQYYVEHLVRLHMGQFNELWNMFIFARKDIPDQDTVRDMEHSLKQMIFPELSLNASHGVGSKQLPLMTHVGWEIFEALREHLGWKTQPWGGWGHQWDEPAINWSGCPRIQIVDDEEVMIYLNFARRFRYSIHKVCKKYEGDLKMVKVNEIKRFAQREDKYIQTHQKSLPEIEYKEIFEELS